MPMLHSERGTDSIQVPLSRVTKIPYVPDGAKELWDVCQPPGVVESKIIAIENNESFQKTAMDCDEYARYLANSIESQHSPLLLSVLCVDKREMKWGIFPKFPGHMVCVVKNDPDDGKIYHIGNWNQKRNVEGDPVGCKKFTHYAYNNMMDMVMDLTSSMAGDNGDVLAWIIMDKDLNVCTWGMGASKELSHISAIDLHDIRSKTLLG